MPMRVKPQNVWAIGLCLVAALILAGYSAVQHAFDRILTDGTVNRLLARKTAVILQADSGYLPLV